VLDILFSLNRCQGGVMTLIVDQHLDSVTLRESGYQAIAVLEDAANQIIGNANVECAPWTTREYVNPELHSLNVYC
jgi:hypothetical protein